MVGPCATSRCCWLRSASTITWEGASRGCASRDGNRAESDWLLVAIAANLALLGYYKYAIFFVSNVQKLIGHVGPLPEIVLPLGISFFTFTQIAFLVDAHRGLARDYSFTHYTLFVTYFPHLIAGPILHHREMMPQFDRRATYTLNWDNVAVGLTMFIIGLFKKTVIADDMAGFASPAFNAAAAGTQLTLLEAWGAALAYTFQIYFDFSGYTDMALGASRMFGIVLPLNFRSPYKARSIIDFWRRWHITLSRFLRDYVYIPLGGNRKSVPRRYENLLLTMLIGGLWHGAGWTFVFWGALHGIYLVINHGWRSLRRRIDIAAPPGARALATLTTFVAVVVAWVFFRASGLHDGGEHHCGHGGTKRCRSACCNGNLPRAAPRGWRATACSSGKRCTFDRVAQLNWLCFLLVFCWVAPNTQQLLAAYRPALITRGYGELGDAGVLPGGRIGSGSSPWHCSGPSRCCRFTATVNSSTSDFEMSSKAFSVACVTAILVLIGCVGLFNRIVDPYWYFRDVEIVGFNYNKPKAVGNERLVKPAWVAKLKPEAVIVGNSVAEIGLPPTHRGFTKDGALIPFNLAMPGATWNETYCLAMFAMRQAPVKRMVVGVSGTDEETCPADATLGQADYGKLLFSRTAFDASRETVRLQRQRASMTREGLWYFDRYDDHLQTDDDGRQELCRGDARRAVRIREHQSRCTGQGAVAQGGGGAQSGRGVAQADTTRFGETGRVDPALLLRRTF